MSRVRRFDYAVSSELAPPQRLANGWLKVDGRISRVGTQSYRNADGTEHVELRLPEEVFDKASLDSFELLPLTNQHPSSMLDANNAVAHTCGSVGHLRRDGDFVAARILITDKAAIAAAEKGRAEISNGYSCELDATQDAALTEKWGKYDFIQRKIVGNHVALVDKARAGAGARLRLDAEDGDAFAVRQDEVASTDVFGETTDPVLGSEPLQETDKMPHSLKVDGHSFEVTDANVQVAVDRAIASAANAEKARVVELEKQLTTLQAKHDSLEAAAQADAFGKCEECEGTGEVDGEKCAACKGSKMLPKKADHSDSIRRMIDRGVKERSALLVRGRDILGANVKLDAMDDLEIKRQVILKLSPALKPALEAHKADANYITVLYDAEMLRAGATSPRAVDLVRTAAAPASKDPATTTNNDEEGDARAKMIAREKSKFVPSTRA